MENGRGDRFSYDEEGQLMEGWYNATNPVNSGAGNTRYDGFAYDALGNRTQNNYVASRGLTSFFRRDNGLNQYSSWSPSVIYHDDNYPGWGPAGSGVMMAEGWITASYNALNQPIAIWSPTYNGTSNFMWFGYDPLGRCVKRWVGDSGDIYSNPATYFHYDGWNLLQEGANAWGPARVYVHGNRVDEIVWSYNTFTGEQAFHHYDARGHATLLTGSSGNILEQYEYDAFGQPYFYDASGNAVGAYDPVQNLWEGYSQFGNRFLFTGREWIPDLKLYDYRNRMYQPELGRFLQPDPQEFAAGDYNLYRYCGNDPVNRNDPMGLASLTSLGGGDWDWFNGSVAAQMRDDIAAMTATAKLETTASAPKSDRPASDTSKSMRMEPAPDPKNPGHYLYDDYKYHRYYYPQLKDKNGRPQPGYNNYAQEVTTVRVNQCSWCPKGKFKVETTDGLPLHELRRDGTLPDRVGLKVKPTSNDNATLILDQRFKYQHGTEEPVMLKSGVTHETRVINGETTINYTPFVDP
jgi:RHS repeat-associated protein